MAAIALNECKSDGMLHTYDIPVRPFSPDTNMNKYLRLQYLELTNLILCTRYFKQVKKSNLCPNLKGKRCAASVTSLYFALKS